MALTSHWLRFGLASAGMLALMVSPALAQEGTSGSEVEALNPGAMGEFLGAELPLEVESWTAEPQNAEAQTASAQNTVVLTEHSAPQPAAQDGLTAATGSAHSEGVTAEDLKTTQDAPLEDEGYRAEALTPVMSGLAATLPPTTPQPETSDTLAQVRPSQDSDAWEYVLSPYLFVPFSVRSDITVGGVTRSVSAGLGDIFSLDKIFAGALRFEARQPQYGFFADASHIFVREGRGVTGFPLPPTVADAILAQTGLPIPPGLPVDASVTGTGRTTTVSLGGYYRVVDQVLGDGGSRAAYPRLMVDPYLGVRLVALNSSLDFDVALAGATRTARLSDSTVLFKPMVGAQVGLELSDQWALGLRGDLSGLAIGADDSFAWGLWAGARYQFSPGWALQMGYQYKDANYSLGQGATRFSIDQTQQGIWTGLDIRL